MTICTGPQRLSAYYAGAGLIPLGTVGFPYNVRTSIPVSGPISISNFYGATYDAGQFINGDFETIVGVTEDLVKYSMVGWTVYKQTTRLNSNAQIENCFTPNQVNIPTPLPPVGITSPGDNVTFSTLIGNNPSFRMRLLDTSDPLFASLSSGSGRYIIELKNEATFAGTVSPYNPNSYGILRGPVLVAANSIALYEGDTVSFKWRAAKDPAGDRFSVYVYLLRTTDCSTITLLDITGVSTGWQTVTYTVPASRIGQYKFIVVHGSYDSVGGLKVGAYLYLDDITLTRRPTTLPVGQTSTTTSTTTTTTQYYSYNGNEELYITPGSFLSKRIVNGGEIYEYRVSVTDNCTFGMRNGKPANSTGGIPPILIESVSGWDQTGNVWLPGPSGSNPVGGGGLHNEINSTGEFRYPYTNLTFRLPGDIFTTYSPSGGGITIQIPQYTSGGQYYSATIAGGGNGIPKGIVISEITTPIRVTAPALPSAENVTDALNSFTAGTSIMYEGDQATFTVTDSRNTTGLLNWRLRATDFLEAPASGFFVGGQANLFVLTGQVALTNGTGQITIQTIANTNPHSPRTLRMEIIDPATQRFIGFQTVGFIDKPYQGQVEFTTPGTHTWTVPTGVWSVSVICVGGGGGGALHATNPCGGAGGNLQFRQVSVVPGTVYTIVVGAGGTAGNVSYAAGGAGGGSSFGLTATYSTANVAAAGGSGGTTIGTPAMPGVIHVPPGTTGATVGYGGSGFPAGGAGGAGGYEGNGGNGSSSFGINGTKGGGGGGVSDGGNGGGVGILGKGADGIGGTGVGNINGTAGSGGFEKAYGGGGGGLKPPETQANAGGSGAVRIIWPGNKRYFPNNNTGNLPTIT